MTPLDEVQQMIDDCEMRQDKLTAWEADFIDSISYRVGHGGSLTEKQDDTLTKIWNRIT